VVNATQPWNGGINDGVNLDDNHSGDVGGALSGNQSTRTAAESVDAGVSSQAGIVHGPAIEAESSKVAGAGLDQGGMDLDDSSDYDEGPVRFRNLNEVYQDSVEVELTSDVEVEALLAVMEEPTYYQDVVGDSEWIAAIESEIQSINKNKTWELVTLPAGHKPIGLKWVYKLKRNADGEVVKNKAKLVAKGYV
jgi:hypothetical protein